MNILTDDLGWVIRNLKARFKARFRRPVPLQRGCESESAVAKLRSCSLFKETPNEKLLQMIPYIEQIRRKAGDVILREGEEGDYFYILLEGFATVARRAPRSATPETLARLEPGAAFGEEALVSMATRNATVTMETDGLLLRMPKNIFVEHVQDLLVTWVSPAEAQRQVAQGARWVDVRDSREMRKGHLWQAISLPLAELRDRLPELDRKTLYICYDERGRQSATAAFLLRQRGFQAAVLRGGLRGLTR